jgi:probable rRNA maturation factor
MKKNINLLKIKKRINMQSSIQYNLFKKFFLKNSNKEKVVFQKNQIKYFFHKSIKADEKIKTFNICNKIIKQIKISNFYINLLLISKKQTKKLNLKWKNSNLTTDILSFSTKTHYAFPKKIILLGDIAIFFNIIKVQSKIFNNTFEEELALLITHGLVHLFGFNHKKSINEKKTQQKIENKILFLSGFDKKSLICRNF